LAWLSAGEPQVFVERLPRLVGQFKSYRPARLALADRRTIERITIRRHVFDADSNNVAAAELAIDRQVEQGEIPFQPLYMQFCSDRPHMARPQWRLAPMSLPLFHGARRAGVMPADTQSSFMAVSLLERQSSMPFYGLKRPTLRQLRDHFFRRMVSVRRD
jgi:hypothetical protein